MTTAKSGETNAIIYVLKYIGSKRRMANTLSAMIPRTCNVYMEPFCGSAALALNSREFPVKILNDYNPHMANFWRVITDPAMQGDLLECLRKTRYSRSEFAAAKERRELYGANREDKVRWAVDTYIINQQSFNADGDFWTYQNVDSYYNFLTSKTGLELALQVLAKQKFRVYNMDARDCMLEEKVLKNPQAFIFLDPPYLEGLRSDGKLYQVDMPDVRDHIDLLKVIRNAKAKIVLSGYWSGWDDGTDLYDSYLIPCGWHRHLLGEYDKGCHVGEAKPKGAEWVWCNYDLKAEAPGAIAFLKSYCDERKMPCFQV